MCTHTHTYTHHTYTHTTHTHTHTPHTYTHTNTYTNTCTHTQTTHKYTNTYTYTHTHTTHTHMHTFIYHYFTMHQKAPWHFSLSALITLIQLAFKTLLTCTVFVFLLQHALMNIDLRIKFIILTVKTPGRHVVCTFLHYCFFTVFTETSYQL